VVGGPSDVVVVGAGFRLHFITHEYGELYGLLLLGLMPLFTTSPA
jgi:hypothetical protein